MQQKQQQMVLALGLVFLLLVGTIPFFHHYGQIREANETIQNCLMYRVDCNQKKLEEATQFYEEEQEKESLTLEGYFWLMQAYLIADRPKTAINLLLEAKEEFPNEKANTHWVLASLYRRIGDSISFRLYGEKAFQEFSKRSLSEAEDSTNTHQLLGIYQFLYVPNDDEMLVFCDSLLKQHPTNRVLLDYKNDILFRKELESGDTVSLPPH